MIASGALTTPRLASSAPTGKYVSKSASLPDEVRAALAGVEIVVAVVEAIRAAPLLARARPGSGRPARCVADAAHAAQEAVLEVDEPAAAEARAAERRAAGSTAARRARRARRRRRARAAGPCRRRSPSLVFTRKKTLSRRSSSSRVDAADLVDDAAARRRARVRCTQISRSWLKPAGTRCPAPTFSIDDRDLERAARRAAAVRARSGTCARSSRSRRCSRRERDAVHVERRLVDAARRGTRARAARRRPEK